MFGPLTAPDQFQDNTVGISLGMNNQIYKVQKKFMLKEQTLKKVSESISVYTWQLQSCSLKSFVGIKVIGQAVVVFFFTILSNRTLFNLFWKK